MELRHETRVALGHQVHSSLIHRLAVRAQRWRLDEALAEGADPTADPLLACRAQQLTARATRHRLALGLRDLVARAGRPARAGSAAPIARLSVRARSGLLLELADRLDADGTVGVRGVAATKLLLTDGVSPLWSRSTPDDLGDAIEAALIGLGS